MYTELYEVWKQELESRELVPIPSDFYQRLADYLKRLREESRMLDRRTVKANLLKKEVESVRRMIHELAQSRYQKLVRGATDGKRIPSQILSPEEESVFKGALSVAEAYQSIMRSVLRGMAPKVDVEPKHKRAIVRLSKDVPAIIGADMKTYGPFKTEDVASLPTENARILNKQAMAEIIEV